RSGAYGRPVGDGGTGVAAGSAVAHVVRRVALAAVPGALVAVLEGARAAPDAARRARAARCPVGDGGAGVAAGSAVAHVVRRVALAAVPGALVAVLDGARAAPDAARRARAARCPVGDGGAGMAAGSAVAHVVRRVALAAVPGALVAVLEGARAAPDAARGRGAGRRPVGDPRADVSARPAVVHVGLWVRTDRAALARPAARVAAGAAVVLRGGRVGADVIAADPGGDTPVAAAVPVRLAAGGAGEAAVARGAVRARRTRIVRWETRDADARVDLAHRAAAAARVRGAGRSRICGIGAGVGSVGIDVVACVALRRVQAGVVRDVVA